MCGLGSRMCTETNIWQNSTRNKLASHQVVQYQIVRRRLSNRLFSPNFFLGRRQKWMEWKEERQQFMEWKASKESSAWIESEQFWDQKIRNDRKGGGQLGIHWTYQVLIIAKMLESWLGFFGALVEYIFGIGLLCLEPQIRVQLRTNWAMLSTSFFSSCAWADLLKMFFQESENFCHLKNESKIDISVTLRSTCLCLKDQTFHKLLNLESSQRREEERFFSISACLVTATIQHDHPM